MPRLLLDRAGALAVLDEFDFTSERKERRLAFTKIKPRPDTIAALQEIGHIGSLVELKAARGYISKTKDGQ